MEKMKKHCKVASFTDIHWGAKGNSEQHLQDCMNFIDWFCEKVKQDPEITHVIMMGDWHEHRSSLSILTMHYSYEGARRLSQLGIPVYIIIGNHDLFHRDSRGVFSTLMFANLPNIHLINEPTVVDLNGNSTLICPYLFPDEYQSLVKYKDVPVWWGHFEFKGFVISGYNTKMEHGSEHTDFSTPTRIFSGHFHKRQVQDNVAYIGNPFGTNFADSGDFHRGMAVYEYAHDELSFIDWEDGPKYVKAKLSQFLDEKITVPANARVRCIIDVPLTYEESIVVKQTFLVQHNLRELKLEESDELVEVLTETQVDGIAITDRLNTVDELVVEMLGAIDTPKIDQNMLVNLYQKLNTEE